MGQVALGLRSLVIKLAIFFVMAALLAWALGGTLFPRAEIVALDPITHDNARWHWQLSVGGRDSGTLRWQMMVHRDGEEPRPHDGRTWAGVAGPLVAGGALYYAGRTDPREDGRWWIERIDATGSNASVPLPDRLAVEQQLGRLAAGLELQDTETILRQRPSVLDPPVE